MVFTAEINAATTESLIQALSNLAQKGVVEIYLGFSTPGGSVMHGITLYNFLRGLPFKLVIHNLGNVDSIGNAIFLAGEERYACPHSAFMFHGVGMDTKAGAMYVHASPRKWKSFSPKVRLLPSPER